jgi:hypothetical protein
MHKGPKFVCVNSVHTTPRGVHIRFYSCTDAILRVAAGAAGYWPTHFAQKSVDILSELYVWRSVRHPQQRPVADGQPLCYPRTFVPTFGGYRREPSVSATWWLDSSNTAIFWQPLYHVCLKIHMPLFWRRMLKFQHDRTTAHYGDTQHWSKATDPVVSKRRPWFNLLAPEFGI